MYAVYYILYVRERQQNRRECGTRIELLNSLNGEERRIHSDNKARFMVVVVVAAADAILL